MELQRRGFLGAITGAFAALTQRIALARIPSKVTVGPNTWKIRWVPNKQWKPAHLLPTPQPLGRWEATPHDPDGKITTFRSIVPGVGNSATNKLVGKQRIEAMIKASKNGVEIPPLDMFVEPFEEIRPPEWMAAMKERDELRLQVNAKRRAAESAMRKEAELEMVRCGHVTSRELVELRVLFKSKMTDKGKDRVWHICDRRSAFVRDYMAARCSTLPPLFPELGYGEIAQAAACGEFGSETSL